MCDGLSGMFGGAQAGSDPAANLASAQKVILASSGLKAIGEAATGMQSQNYFKFQQAQAQSDANAEQQLGAVRAAQTRKAGSYVQSQATAAYGASGVNVNSGSAQATQSFIGKNVEQDALTELYTGKRRAAAKMTEAQGFGLQGQNALWGGVAAGGKSLLSGAAASAKAQTDVDKWTRRYRPSTSMYGNPDQLSE